MSLSTTNGSANQNCKFIYGRFQEKTAKMNSASPGALTKIYQEESKKLNLSE
jgi:hypothetical protein